jgi:hypothetical protein
MDFESPTGDSMGDPTAAAEAFDAFEPDILDGEPSDVPTDWETPTSAADDTSLRVPEVTAVTFRYFDGANWTDTWNSIQRKSLPAAVEVQFELALDAEGRTPTEVAEASALDDPAMADWPDRDPETTASAVSGTGTPYRLVVDLPGSPEYRALRADPAPQIKPRPSTAPVRRIAPPRWTPRKKTSSRSDQWIRTDTP